MDSSVASPDPKVLGNILLLQTTLHTIPEPSGTASFLCRGLELIPATNAVAVSIKDITSYSSDSLKNKLDTLNICDLCIDPNSSRKELKSRFIQTNGEHFLCLPVLSMHEFYGCVVFECTNIETLSIYRSFLENLTNTVALTLENREHENDLRQLNIELQDINTKLEDQVYKRTKELVTANNFLLDSEAKYRDLFENANDAIFLLDNERNFVDANQKAAEIFGYTRDEFLNLNVFDLIPSEQFSKSENEFNKLDEHGQYEKFIGKIRCKQGNYLDVEISSSSIIKDGKTLGSRDIIRDITDRLRYEEQFRHTQKMEAIGTLAGGIAHDFNNILAAIIGYAELTQTGLPMTSPVKNHIDQVLKAANRAKELVKQILTFSHKGQEQKTNLQPATIIKEALKLIRATLPASIQIKENIDPGVGYIHADPTNIHQILVNLCTNALHAMENEKGVLSVSLTQGKTTDHTSEIQKKPRPDNFVRLTVADTGCGMDKATKKRIFEPYFSTKDIGIGTGMGLSLVHGIVQSSDGYIDVKSKPGKGSEFNIYFPLIDDNSDKFENKLQKLTPTGNERILVIDDEADLVDLYREILEQQGYQVTTFIDSEAAVDRFLAKPDDFDLIITDQTMPNISGSELAKILLKIRPDIPIVLCTGFSSRITDESAKEIGIKRFLMKPVSRANLTMAVREALDSHTKTN